MTWFTDSPFEKMMTQKPGNGRHRDDTPPVPRSPACTGCPYNKGLDFLLFVVMKDNFMGLY